MGDAATGEAPQPDVAVGEATRRDEVAGEATRPDEAAGEAPRPDVAAGEAPRPDVAAGEEVGSRAAGTRRRRRVTTQAVPGSDPTPQKEPASHAENENDERLKADKPPHWG
ncbi:MAG: hypothetical protein LH605_06075 [Microbacteriaceae bacterium]|nr:hypothetical protein [Microbacteriaceae bacterium]